MKRGIGRGSGGTGRPYRRGESLGGADPWAGVEAQAEKRVMPSVYTRTMAKVMISIPDALLGMLDAEAARQRTSRSGLLQNAARRELGLVRRSRESLLAELDELSGDWSGPVDVVELIRADRRRDS